MCTLGLVLLLPMAAEAKGNKRHRVRWHDVPVEAQAAITENFGKANVIEVDMEVNNQLTIYAAELRMPDGTVTVVKVTRDGKVLNVKKHARVAHKHRPLFG